ncbi:polysaccharide deacetylase family protein [Aquimarina algicola]|uniref:Polysaccharide deacetylase family protein n=1 Tax=Aquimarina algicola TaxID=2589995 RepID=A0A504JHZ1_9FLAO|nr:polysaccharide deacetylase family protein [Aquimarina algicola]TPN86090.1 polysaccharide deacetylase family protein [Aquimarina algicola]
MNIIPVKTPYLIKSIFSNYIWDLPETDKKKIYLTFDDGPIPEVTDFVLAQLENYSAKATFFCIGDNIQKHPDIFKRIITNQHAIGNHTMNHIKVWKHSKSAYIQNTIKCQNIINSNTRKNENTILFRPPYGQISISTFKELKKLGYKIILWDILSKDWDKKTSPEKCLKNIIDNTKAGSIIVFHDSYKAAKNMKFALPKVLDYYTKRGYTFEKITF